MSYAYEIGVLAYDLEKRFEKIENRGVPALLRLRYGHTLSTLEKSSVVAFLDMHLDRGRYANQTQIRTPALALKTGGRVEEAQLNLGDRFMLSQSMDKVLRLTSRGLEQWPWTVYPAANLVTGDGAILLWTETGGGELTTVTFPMSPTQLLAIGQGINRRVNFNIPLVMNSLRWIVGRPGTPTEGHADLVVTELLRGRVLDF